MRITATTLLALVSATGAQDLGITLERVNSPSAAVVVTDYSTFSDGAQLKLLMVVENRTQYELYFVRGDVIYKDSTGVPVASDLFFFDGEGQYEYSDGKFTDSVPANTSAIRQACVACLDSTSEERIRSEAVSVVVTLSWSQAEPRIDGDIDWDGDVDFDDFFILADNFGRRIVAGTSKRVVSVSDEEREIASLKAELTTISGRMP